MHIPSFLHLLKYLETMAGRDEEDIVTITMPLADLRILAAGVRDPDQAQLTDDSQSIIHHQV